MKKLLLILASFSLLAGCMMTPRVIVEERQTLRYYVETAPVYVYRSDRRYYKKRVKVRVVRKPRVVLYKRSHRRGNRRRYQPISQSDFFKPSIVGEQHDTAKKAMFVKPVLRIVNVGK